MTFEIRIKDKSLKFVSSLQKSERERLKEAILILKDEPVPVKSLDVAKLKGEKNAYARESLESFTKSCGNKNLF